MKIRYEVGDGYAGGSRPHYVTVDDGDLADCETREEKIALIDECVDDHFRATIIPSWDQSQLPE